MSEYRIHRLKDHLKRQFRYAPHVSGRALVKPRDYDAGDSVEASSPYQVFFALRDSGTPLEVGDLLETSGGDLRIFKFVGFEEAAWAVPEPKPEPGPGQVNVPGQAGAPGQATAPGQPDASDIMSSHG